MSAFLSSIEKYLYDQGVRVKPTKNFIIENKKRLKQLQLEAKEQAKQKQDKSKEDYLRLRRRRKAGLDKACQIRTRLESRNVLLEKRAEEPHVTNTADDSNSGLRNQGIQTHSDPNEAYRDGVIVGPSRRPPTPPPLPGTRNVALQSQLEDLEEDQDCIIPLKESGEIDYVRLNAIKPLKARKPFEKIDVTKPPPSYRKGVLPRYLKESKKQHVAEMQKRGLVEIVGDEENSENLICLSEDDKKEHIRKMRQVYTELVSEMNCLPLKSDSLKIQKRRLELEEALGKIEDGIKMLSLSKLYVRASEP